MAEFSIASASGAVDSGLVPSKAINGTNIGIRSFWASLRDA